jgi:hypothetical protein
LHGAKVKGCALANKILSFNLQKTDCLRRIILCCTLCVVFVSVKSQTFLSPVSILYTRTNTYSSIHNDAFSFAANQAALARSKNFSAGFYGERRFMLADLSSYQLAVALPTSSGNFGLKGNYMGNTAFNETGLGLAYARSIGQVDVGVQFNYYQVRTAGYGNASAVNFEIGGVLHVTDQFQIGVHIYNPTRSSIGKTSEEKLPMNYSFGLGYDVSEKFFIGTEIRKEEDEPVDVNIGLQYSFDKKLFARAGISSATSSFYFGAGFLWNGFRIDVTTSIHPSLGATPGMLIVYNSPAKN